MRDENLIVLLLRNILDYQVGHVLLLSPSTYVYTHALVHTHTHTHSHLIQRWVDYLTASLSSAAKENLSLESFQPLMDGLTCQLLTFSKLCGSLVSW